MIEEIAVLDVAALCCWLGLGGIVGAERLDLQRAVLSAVTIEEAAHFLVLHHDGDPAGLAGDLVAIETAPTVVRPVFGHGVAASQLRSESLPWGVAAAAAVALSERLPLVSVFDVAVPNLRSIRWWLADR